MQTHRRETLRKSERLCSERSMDALFSKGRRGNVGPLRFCFLASDGVESDGELDGGRSGSGAGGEFDSRKTSEQGDAAVSVLFSVPKKAFKKAWKRNLIKRRMRESYRRRKHALTDAALAAGRHIDIALICSPSAMKGAMESAKVSAKRGTASPEIPDFATIDNAIAKILEKILVRI